MAEPKARIEPQLYDDFLAELRELDAFRGLLSERHPDAQLRRDDPDVRRLLEAVAFFTMRSRRQLMHSLEATWLRMFSEQFAPLVTPLPATAILKAIVKERRADVALLPRGTELQLTSGPAAASFRTLDDLRILPVKLTSAVLLKDAASRYDRIAIELTGRFARKDAVGLLRLHTRIVDDYAASATFLYLLRDGLQRAHVVYDGVCDVKQVGERCEVSYGSDYQPQGGTGSGGPAGGPETTAPLERARAFFHFPERELFLNLKVPSAPGNGLWQRLIIYLDVKPGRITQRIGTDLFHLHAVPVENQRREWAMPIHCDGTQDAHPIRHPSPEQGHALRSVLGVYVTQPSGLLPLVPELLQNAGSETGPAESPTSERPSYAVEERQTTTGPRSYLIVRAPLSLLKPLHLQVDALWYQPGFAEQCLRSGSPVHAMLMTRVLDGVGWETLGGIRAESTSEVRGDTSKLMRILSMSMRPVVKEADLRWFMSLLIGASGPAVYRALPTRLEQVSWKLSPDAALSGSGVRHVYSARLPIEPGEDEALAWHFLRRVYEVLDAWNQDSTIDLKVDTGETRFGLPLTAAVERERPPVEASQAEADGLDEIAR